jgi:hypothetical protein
MRRAQTRTPARTPSGARIRRAVVTAVCAGAWLLGVAPAVAQQPRCEKPLALDDLAGLLEARTGDARVQQMVTDCGVSFPMDDAAERRLRKAGASKAVLALARLAATGRGAAAGPSTTPASPSPAPVTSGAAWLEVARDESSLERRIQDYLKAKGLAADTNEKSEDLRLWLAYAAGEAPAYDLAIDTLSSARDGTERVVQINLFSKQIIDASRYDEVLRRLNEYHRLHWHGTFHVDRDNEIVGQWHLNIPGAGYPLHLELVYDAVQRLTMAWPALYKELAPMIDHAR